MTNLRKLISILWSAFLLASCDSHFASIVLAPASAQTIASPAELPYSLLHKTIVWYGIYRLDDATGDQKVTLPDDDAGFAKLSADNRYLVYMSQPVIPGQNLPIIGDTSIKMLDLLTGEERILVSLEQSYPDAVSFAAPTFSMDGKKVIFVVEWEHFGDLVEVDLENNAVRRLNTNVVITNFGYPDISSQGQIVVICKGPETTRTSELCLLNDNGNFIRYLTSEKYPWPGNALFTPDGKYVIYESRYVLYKVSVDGTDRQQLSSCGSPILVTEESVVAWCFISQKPDCYSLFVVNLDGSNFRRLNYIEPHCSSQ